MFRKYISILLTVVFMAFITAPTVISMIDNSIDMSLFYASAEDEEKGNEKNLDIEVLTCQFNDSDLDIALLKSENSSWYYFKKYPKPHLNLISPPPDFI
jgi:hypothetical protein